MPRAGGGPWNTAVFLYTHHTFCFFDCGSLPQLVGRDGVGCELVQRNTESHLFAVIEQIFQHIAGWWLQTFAMINYHVDYTHIYIILIDIYMYIGAYICRYSLCVYIYVHIWDDDPL